MMELLEDPLKRRDNSLFFQRASDSNILNDQQKEASFNSWQEEVSVDRLNPENIHK